MCVLISVIPVSTLTLLRKTVSAFLAEIKVYEFE